jgi:hypothetical protein
MSTEPREGQLPVGALVASIGAALLIVSLFLDWYDTVTGFTVFEVLDLVLVLLAFAAIASLLSAIGMIAPAISTTVSLGVAVLAAFIVLTQIVNDPPAVVGPGPDKAIGIWLALSGTALMVAGAVLGFAQISLAFEPRARVVDRHEAETATAPAADPETEYGSRPAAAARPDPETEHGGRPAASGDPTRPLADPDAPPPPRSDRP